MSTQEYKLNDYDNAKQDMDGEIANHTEVDVETKEEKKALAEKPFAGMDKETLLQFSQTPFWRRLRMIFSIIFVLGWLSLLAAVIGIAVVYPRCTTAPKLKWWQEKITYQIYPRSFQDSDGDGVGDLKGVKSRLDYLKDLGIGAIWMSPVYTSPMKDFGYDVSDFIDIDGIFGTMADFDELIKAIHEKGMYLIMDFIPNHTSLDHPWFEKSRKATSPEDPYYSYYVWKDCNVTNLGNVTQPPTNWLSVFGGSAWSYDLERKQCYLHQFLKEQPDLDLRNPLVKEELKNVLKFWLDKGVDGFRVDAIKHGYEDYLFRDEAMSGMSNNPERHEYLYHNYTTNVGPVYALINDWRELLNEKGRNGTYKYMVVESYGDIKDIKRYYGVFEGDGSDMPFNFQLLEDLTPDCSGTCVKHAVDNWLGNMPEGEWPNWVVGNHDSPRIVSKMGQAFVNAINMLLLLLPGTPTTYYGEELGMSNIPRPADKSLIKDPYGQRFPNSSRDPYRSPMQWTNTTHAGFSNITGDTWLPLNENFKAGVNVEDEDGDSNSALNVYRALASLRNEPAFQYGNLHYAIVNENIFSYVKEWNGKKSYLVAINFGKANATTDFTKASPWKIPSQKQVFGIPSSAGSWSVPDEAEVVMTTRNGLDSTLVVEEKVSLTAVKLAPGQGVVFSWDYAPMEYF